MSPDAFHRVHSAPAGNKGIHFLLHLLQLQPPATLPPLPLLSGGFFSFRHSFGCPLLNIEVTIFMLYFSVRTDFS